MRVVMFYHSLVSDWNHGNAHFLRGVVSELLARGHDVAVLEPHDAWSARNLVAEQGEQAVDRFHATYPGLESTRYGPAALDLDELLDGASLVLVHEWNDHQLVRRIGQARSRSRDFRLLFHDTHHRSVTESASMAAYELVNYDGVLAFGRVVRDIYLARAWAERAWTWHEAADVRVFHPIVPRPAREGDLVWIGNWGDDERTRELEEFLIEPVRSLRLTARVHGVRYPEHAIRALTDSGIEYAGWIPNFEVPREFARFGATIHVPRRPYASALPGIPTIRVFEALACGIPLVSAPWSDDEGLFTPGSDYLVARDGAEMQRHLRTVLADDHATAELAEHGRRTILARHTCAHRVDELLAIARSLGLDTQTANPSLPCTSPSSAPASCPPTGTAPPRTTAASYVRSTTADTE